jgi:hypothetical protein
MGLIKPLILIIGRKYGQKKTAPDEQIRTTFVSRYAYEISTDGILAHVCQAQKQLSLENA